MASNKSDTGFFEILGTIFTWVKWILVLAVCVSFFVLGTNLYPIFKDCWTCNVFENIYDAFSVISMQTFSYFQDKVIVIISVCLALWIVYETYKALSPSLSLYPEQDKIDENYFKTIYKKIFLVVAVVGLFIVNNPRNIFANTFEITLDFGSGVGRELLRKKITDPKMIPPECQNMPDELIYKEGHALSENTKNNMVCLLKEVHALKYTYTDIGIELFEYGAEPILTTVVVGVSTKVLAWVGGFITKKIGNRILKVIEDKIKRLDILVEKFKKKDPKNTERLENLKKLKDQLEKGKNTAKNMVRTGKFIKEHDDWFGILPVIISFLSNENVRMGVAGLGITIGLFIINLFFAFIIIEQLLFLGVTIILLPIIAGCYIFEQTRSFATTALQRTFSYAIGLIFLCIGMVMCAEINDWILGGMFSAPIGSNITTPQQALSFLQSGDIESFNAMVGDYWYFLYVFFAIGINALIMKESQTFAGWFNGNISDSSLVEPLKKLGKSSYTFTTSVIREVKEYRKSGSIGLADKGSYIDTLLKKRKLKKLQKEQSEKEQV